MKILLIALTLMSSTVFAGSYVKLDEGNVSWSVSVKDKKGSMKLKKTLRGFKNINLTENEMDAIRDYQGRAKASLSQRSISFQNSDERSQESISNVIKMKMIDELAGLDVNVGNSEISFSNLNCEEKGSFNRKLTCTAQFESKIEVDIQVYEIIEDQKTDKNNKKEFGLEFFPFGY